jgi:hypothetical protein
MPYGKTKTRARILGTSLCLSVLASAQCRPVDVVIAKGRVENATAHSTVRVELVYPKQKPGESGEVTVENGAFQIPLYFVTMQSSIFTFLPTRCSRKPKTVVITLLQNGQESDHVFLDFAESFRMADTSAYTSRSEIVLNARH